jgi:hypothetical protein
MLCLTWDILPPPERVGYSEILVVEVENPLAMPTILLT